MSLANLEIDFLGKELRKIKKEHDTAIDKHKAELKRLKEMNLPKITGTLETSQLDEMKRADAHQERRAAILLRLEELGKGRLDDIKEEMEENFEDRERG